MGTYATFAAALFQQLDYVAAWLLSAVLVGVIEGPRPQDVCRLLALLEFTFWARVMLSFDLVVDFPWRLMVRLTVAFTA